MPFHSASKTISSEISMSGDYLRLEGNMDWKICPASGHLTNRVCPGAGNLTKKFARGAGFDRFLKICPGVTRRRGMVTLGID